MNLKDILKEIGVKEKPERKDTLLAVAEERIEWTYNDKTVEVTNIKLTKYQLYWLMWRVRVHLRSYEQMEWSEMKDVLTDVLKLLEKEWEECQHSTVVPIAKETSLVEIVHPLCLVDTV